MLARRGYNVQSLAVGHSEVEGRSRITTVIPGSSESTAKLIKQLNKVINVVKARGPAAFDTRPAICHYSASIGL